jgi:hypothetical protein
VATRVKNYSHEVVEVATLGTDGGYSLLSHFPRTIHGITLVTGGVRAVASLTSRSALNTKDRSWQDLRMKL